MVSNVESILTLCDSCPSVSLDGLLELLCASMRRRHTSFDGRIQARNCSIDCGDSVRMGQSGGEIERERERTDRGTGGELEVSHISFPTCSTRVYTYVHQNTVEQVFDVPIRVSTRKRSHTRSNVNYLRMKW